MKIKCVIADDEAPAREVIKNHLSKLDNFSLTTECANGIEVYNALQDNSIDLLFIDIQMPQFTGIEVLKAIKEPPPVIITTAYRDFALEGFELNVIDYLLKPISFERFLKAIDKYEARVHPELTKSSYDLNESLNDNEPFIYVKADRKMVKILLNDVLFIESLKDYVRIVTKEKHVITNQTLIFFQEKLNADQFIRVHRSFIISIKKIETFTTTGITIGTTFIPIGNTYYKEVLKRLNGL